MSNPRRARITYERGRFTFDFGDLSYEKKIYEIHGRDMQGKALFAIKQLCKLSKKELLLFEEDLVFSGAGYALDWVSWKIRDNK